MITSVPKHLLLASLFVATSAVAQVTAPSVPAPEISTIVLPIRAQLTPLLPLLEAQVPRKIEKTNAYELDPDGRFGVKYRLLRDPMALNMIGSGLHVTTTVHYGIEGCPVLRGAVRNACISCGLTGEPPRSAVIELQSRITLGGDWTFHTKTTARPLQFLNRCQVTFLGIDITDWKLRPIIEGQLRTAARTIDEQTPRVASIRRQATEIWKALQAPIPVARDTWLIIEPIDVAMAPIRGSAQSVSTALALHAHTRIVVGAMPPAGAVALPALKAVENGDGGIRIAADIELPYDAASKLLDEQFANRTWPLEGKATLAINSVKLSPAAGGKLAVDAEIDYRGGFMKNYRGLIQLEGTPVFDPATASVSVPDLDYTIDARRRNPFIRLANRLAHDTVRANLRSGAKWSIAPQIAATRAEIERGLTRALAPNVVMRGSVAALAPQSLTPQQNAIVIRVIATGAAEVEAK